jgi:RNA recognition motif-containing protein
MLHPLMAERKKKSDKTKSKESKKESEDVIEEKNKLKEEVLKSKDIREEKNVKSEDIREEKNKLKEGALKSEYKLKKEKNKLKVKNVKSKDIREEKNVKSEDIREENNFKSEEFKEEKNKLKEEKTKTEKIFSEAKHKKRDLCSEENKLKNDKIKRDKKNIFSKEEITEGNNFKGNSNNKKSHNLSSNYYIRNILIVSNLAYKETEESISECFKSYGSIEKVQMSYSKNGKFIGKAIVKFKHDVKIDNEIVWNHKVLRIERMKNKIVNDKRIFVSHINKNLTILQIRNILKEFGIKPKDIRTRFESETKRNNGYCHITYTDSVDAKKFEKEWSKFKAKLGQEVFFEYAHEKVSKHRK